MKATNCDGIVTSSDGKTVLERACRAHGVAAGTRYGLVLRHGRVLCALPLNKETALRTLALYQPQRPKAKLLKWGFVAAAKAGKHMCFLTNWLSPNGSTGGDEAPGILVGSAGHLCERAVTVSASGRGWRVTKLAFGENGGEILSAEAAMLRALAEDERVPALLSFTDEGETARLTMSWQDGTPWNSTDITPVIRLLETWASQEAARPLVTFPEWTWIEAALRTRSSWKSQLDSISEIPIRPGIRHGDLTRPNLRIAANGSLLVHDWERGATSGISCLDLVHFLMQDELFRKKRAPIDAILITKSHLTSSLAADLLASAGWKGRENILMAATFGLNTGAGYIDQTALLDALGLTF